jgi:hypothetical protein
MTIPILSVVFLGMWAIFLIGLQVSNRVFSAVGGKALNHADMVKAGVVAGKANLDFRIGRAHLNLLEMLPIFGMFASVNCGLLFFDLIFICCIILLSCYVFW